MKKSSTSLFVIFLIILLFSLAFLNYFKDYPSLVVLPIYVLPAISIFLIVLFFIFFIYREKENRKIQSEFFTIVAHKFRTPLTGIRWMIDMLQKDMTLLEKRDMLMELQKANERLMEIVDLLVGFAKFYKNLTYAYSAISLSEIVSVSLGKYSSLIKSREIKFSLGSDTGLPLVIIDKAKIQFVVDMLIDNALKYSHRSGTISVDYELRNNTLILRVKDNGIGMKKEDLKKIFKNFFRADNAKAVDSGGLGLGLYTAQKIVKNHKGKLWAESEGVDKGTTFCLELPIKS